MRSILTRVSVATAALALLLAGLPRAAADTINLTLNSGGPNITLTYKTTTETVGGGPFSWTQSSPLNSNYPTGPNGITTYCADLDHVIKTGNTYQYSVSTNLATLSPVGNDSAKITAINELYAEGYKDSFNSSANEAAFQLALWKLIYDGPSNLSFSSGNIRATGTVAQDATNLLNNLGQTKVNEMSGYELAALTSTNTQYPAQGQIMVIPAPPPPHGVPAPPAVMLAGIGVLALIGRARWNRRATAA